MNWICVMMEKKIQTMRSYLKIGKFLGVEPKTWNEIPNISWNMADSKMEGRQLMRAKQISKAFSDKIAYLIYPDNPTFLENNDVQGTKVYWSSNKI